MGISIGSVSCLMAPIPNCLILTYTTQPWKWYRSTNPRWN